MMEKPKLQNKVRVPSDSELIDDLIVEYTTAEMLIMIDEGFVEPEQDGIYKFTEKGWKVIHETDEVDCGRFTVLRKS